MFFKKKINYNKEFESRDSIFSFLYGDRSRTATILGDENFLAAWHASPNASLIEGVMKAEAEKGDLPSIKQMIWLYNIYFQNARDLSSDTSTVKKIQIKSLEDRAKFCLMAVELGERQASYQAMRSYQNLYSIYMSSGMVLDDLKVKVAILGICSFAEQFLDSGYGDEELIQDAKDALKEHRVMAMFISSQL